MRIVAASDWVIDIGPGAGDEGGRVVAAGPPAQVARAQGSRTAPYMARFLDDAQRAWSARARDANRIPRAAVDDDARYASTSSR
jgi:hypothetical protein